jgi:hypothetical protein
MISNRICRSRFGGARGASRSTVGSQFQLLSPRYQFDSTTLEAVGTDGADTIVVDATTTTITVTVNGVPASWPAIAYNAVEIRSGGGNDAITVVRNTDERVSVLAGDGVDSVTVGTTDDATIASVDTGPGADRVYVNPDSSGTAEAWLLPDDAANRIESLALIDVRVGGKYVVPAEADAVLTTGDEELYGTIDLNNNAWVMIAAGGGGTPAEDLIYAALRNGLADGSWTGTDGAASIACSHAGDTSDLLDGLGFYQGSQLPGSVVRGIAIQPSDFVMAYGLFGDSDLDGAVDFDDLIALATHYNQASTRWIDGDFNYDNVVNFDDLLTLAANYGAGPAPSPAPLIERPATPPVVQRDDEGRVQLRSDIEDDLVVVTRA